MPPCLSAMKIDHPQFFVMKHLPLLRSSACITLFVLISAFVHFSYDVGKLQGAWSLQDGNSNYALLASDGYCMLTVYDSGNKKFISSWGGTFTNTNEQLLIKVEFHSNDKGIVGKTIPYHYSIENNALTTNITGSPKEWIKTDNGKDGLSGNWRIIQRKQDDKMIDIPLRPRRTLKLLTGSRFQWAAIDVATGEFHGTGGGTYTFNNGKYTEHIEFFSRDNSRVGSALSFNGKIENGSWIHSGLSSKGDPIY